MEEPWDEPAQEQGAAPEGALHPAPTSAAPDGPVARRRSAEVLPKTSYVDRYRGTVWDHSPPPVVVAPKPSRRPPTWIVLVAGVALLIVGLGAGVYLTLGAQHPGGLTSFVHMTQPPAPIVIVPPITPDPAIATPLPTPGPSAPPWASDPLHPAGLFIANMTAANATYHVDVSLTMTAGMASAAMAEAADVAGADFAMAATLTTPARTTLIACVYKSGYFYDKLDAWPWVQRALTAPPAGILGYWTADTWAGMQYVGPETVDGRLLHHLRLPVDGWPGDADTMATLGISLAPPVFTFDIWVDDGGRPQTAMISAEVTMRIDGRDVQVAMTGDYRFSKFGKRITIAAPTHYRLG